MLLPRPPTACSPCSTRPNPAPGSAFIASFPRGSLNERLWNPFQRQRRLQTGSFRGMPGRALLASFRKSVNRSVEGALDGFTVSSSEPQFEFVTLCGRQRGNTDCDSAPIGAQARICYFHGMLVVVVRSVIGSSLQSPYFKSDRISSHTGVIERIAEGHTQAGAQYMDRERHICGLFGTPHTMEPARSGGIARPAK